MALMEMRQSLCGLCRFHGWSYGVRWKVDKCNPRLMVLCDNYYEEQIRTVIEKTITQVHSVGEGTIGVAAISEKHQWIYCDNFVEGNSEWHHYFLAGIKTIVIISLPSFGVVQFGSTKKISESLEFINQVRHLFCQQENMTGYSLPGHVYKTQGVHDPCGSFASLIYSGHTHASPKSIDLFHDVIAKELQSNAEPSTGSFRYANYSPGPGASICVNDPLMKMPSTNSISSFQFTSQSPVSGSPTPGFSLSNNMQSSYTFPSSPFATNLNMNSWAKDTSTLPLPEQRLLPENPFHYSCMDSISLSSSKSSSIASELPDNFLSFPQDSTPENSGLFQFKDDQTNDQIDLCDQPSVPLSTKNNITSVENVASTYSPSTDLPSEPAEISVTTACDWKECSSNGHAQLPLDNDLFEGMELDLSPRILRQECWDDVIMPLGTDSCLNLTPGVSDCMPSFEQPLESLVGDCTNLSSSTTHSSIPISFNFGHQVSTVNRVDSSQGNTKLALLPEFSLEKIIQQSSKEAPPKLHASSNINAESAVTYKPKKPEENAKVRKRARPGESTRPRPKDRQQIQDRVKELREIVPNGAKCSIDALLDRTIKHMLFLQSVTKYADKLKQTDEPKMLGNEGGVILKDNSGNNAHSGGATWAYEVAGQTMVCPILVEDLNPPGQMLVEMLCEERGFFLEIADVICGFGLTILQGVMEIRERKIWARFLVEATRDVTRMDIFLSLVQLLQQTSSLRTNEQQSKALDKEVPNAFSNYQPPRLSTPIRLQ